MLALGDSRWSDLSHAYGSAAEIPDLLRNLVGATSPMGDSTREPWFSLWSSLCHQGDVYDASYAAVPHIVEIGCGAAGPIDFSFFQLPAAIEIARNNGRGPQVPSELIDAYAKSLGRLSECIAIHRNDHWDQATLQSILCAQAVAKGGYEIAEVIMNLDDYLITKLINLNF